MIFVTVGTQKFQFDRLIRLLDDLVERGAITDNVFAQIGYSNYTPQNYEYVDFINKELFDRKVEECNLLICHSGVATIMEGLKKDKPIIVVPRLAKYGEHVDDHQVQIAETFLEQNYIFMCEKDNMAELINKAGCHKFKKYISNREAVNKVIKAYIDTLF